jgi:hypothetical protein
MAWIRTDDPGRADLLDMLSQAQALAQRLRPGAGLVRIYAGEVTGGTVDVRKSGAVTYHFEFDEYDKSQPPGKDHVLVAVDVVAGNGQLWAYTHGGARVLRGDLEGKPLAIPCASRRAWAAAVKSGVPENAVASFDYEAAFVFDPPPRPGQNNRRREWNLRVKGHPELRRSLDPATCEPFAKKTNNHPSPKPTRMPQWPFK